MKAQRISGIALPIHVLGTRWGLAVNSTPQDRPGTLCAQIWVGFRVDLDGYQKNLNTPSF